MINRNKKIICITLLLIIISFTCADDEIQEPLDDCPTVTDSISYTVISDSSGDTLAYNSFSVRQPFLSGGVAIHRIYIDSTSSYAIKMHTFTLDTFNVNFFNDYPFKFRPYQDFTFKYFSFPEMGIDPISWDVPFDIFYNKLKDEIAFLNRDPHRFDLEIGLVDDDGNHYTNLPFEGNYRSLGRFSNAQEVLDITVHYLDTLTIQGLIYDELAMRFINMKCSVEGHLLNENDWTDSLYIEGEFDIYFTPNQEKFECDL